MNIVVSTYVQEKKSLSNTRIIDFVCLIKFVMYDIFNENVS